MSKIIEVDKDNFKKEVLDAKGVVVVDFWASWCGPCKALVPILDEVAQELHELKFVKINVDQNSKLATKYNVMSIPTIEIFKDGKIIDQLIGIQDKKSLISKFKKLTE